jgi:hypothetical protein
MALALKDLVDKLFLINVNIAYKPKAKKVHLVNMNNRTGEGPRGHPN